MRRARLLATILAVAIYLGYSASNFGAAETGKQTPAASGEVAILQSWQGDYPTAQLNLLPEKQREQAVGFIDNGKTFERIWKAFRPGEAVPKIDFKANLVLFARNTQFYNRIAIGKVIVTNSVAEVLAMETMSAMPIEDKIGMPIVVVPRKGISVIQTGDKNVSVKKDVG